MQYQPIKTIQARRGASTRSWLAVIASLAVTTTASQAQKLYYESFDNIPLGPSVEEEIPGSSVWSKTGPLGWVSDDTGVPGVGTDLDGVTEWAGWSFADKNWWARTAGNQRRVEWTYAQGTVLINDPDEWDDASHAPGLMNSYITTPVISLKGVEAGSLVMTLDSSWRPEAFDDGAPNFPVDGNGRPINHQNGVIWLKAADGTETEILNFDSDSASPNFHKDGDFINEAVVIPLNNAAGDFNYSLKFAMLSAANDWWWAVDNIAIGVPPFVSGITNNGVSFGARITEALDKTINDGLPITADLDAQVGVPVTVERDGETGRVWVSFNQEPTVFAPNSKHVVKVKYTTGEGKSVEDSIAFTAPGYTTVSSTPTSVRAIITEAAGLLVDETKGVTLDLDGTAVTATSVERVDTTILVNYTLATPFASGSTHTLKVKFTTGAGQALEETVSFKATAYETIPEAIATDIGTGIESGMRWRTHQLATGRGNSISEVEKQLRGELGESVHNADNQGEDGYFLIDFVNFDQGAGPAGNFKDGADGELNVADALIPGIPGTTASTDNIGAEALTYVEIPAAGIYQMVVNSDDGFQLSVGPTGKWTQLVLGKFDGGRGQSDSAIYFRVTKPGVYPFRLLWFEGGSDARVEWFSVNADGTRALVGGAQAGALAAFRQRNEPVANGIESFTKGTDGKITIAYVGTLKSAANVSGPFEAVAGATSPAVITPSEARRFYRAE